MKQASKVKRGKGKTAQNMIPPKSDLSILKELDLEVPPVGVKFLFSRPKGIEKLDKKLALCEMIREAQQGRSPFYAAKDNEACFGKVVLGMEEAPSFAPAGRLGYELDLFQDERACARLYQFLYKMGKGTVNYVVFSSMEQLSFDPDVLFLMCDPDQAEIVLRAMTYATGEMWTTKGMGVLGCSFLFAYPYLSGNVNYTVTGLAFGAKAKQVFPKGRILISIPYSRMRGIVESLREMTWALPAYSEGRAKFTEREEAIISKLEKEGRSVSR